MNAIQQPNVSVHFTAVTNITPDGVIGADGTEVKCDTIVTATGKWCLDTCLYVTLTTPPGFDVSFKPRFPVIGRNGVSPLLIKTFRRLLVDFP
jgi:hypothetical protein